MGLMYGGIDLSARRNFGKVDGTGLFVVAHRAVFVRTPITWCGPLYPGETTLPDPDPSQWLFGYPRPENGGEVMHMFGSVNCELVAPRFGGTCQDRNMAERLASGIFASNEADALGGGLAAVDWGGLD